METPGNASGEIPAVEAVSGKQAEYALAQTVPASLTGLLAVLKYEREFSERGDTLFAGDTLANFFEATETAIRNQLASA